MEYLTGNHSDEDIRTILDADRFLKDDVIWDLIEKLAAADDNVDLFATTENGDRDKSTWGDVDYEPLVDGIWRMITIHSHHQQRCENYVQMAALIAKTLVGETRRTWRAIAVSAIIRRFNQEAVDVLRAAESDPEKRKKIKRAEGANRIRLFAKHIREFMEAVDAADGDIIDQATRDQLAESISDKTLKASAEELKELEKSFEAAFLREELTKYKAELPQGYTRTAILGGRVLLRILTKKAGYEPVLDAELIARKIPEEDKDFIKEFGEDANLGVVTIQKKKAALKQHQTFQDHKENPKLSYDDHFKLTKSLLPQSAEMQELLVKQRTILSELCL